ncbi:hypothetical protein ScPMuIL_015637 [Solemya velum]
MPRAQRKQSGAEGGASHTHSHSSVQQQLQAKRVLSNDEEEDSRSSPQSSIANSPTRDDVIMQRVSKKRPAPVDETGEGNDFGNEMQKMLECFGADVTKTLIAKRKRIENLTQNSLKSSNKKVDDIWKLQQSERNKLSDEYCRQLNSVFQQWESDLEKTKDQEEKLTGLFKQQQKLFQQARVVQSQRLKTIRQLQEQYSKGTSELDKYHMGMQTNIQGEMKKEMALLQKRILMDTQQQEMANVRKSLQTMLF